MPKPIGNASERKIRLFLKSVVGIGLALLFFVLGYDIKDYRDRYLAKNDFFYKTRDQVIVGKTLQETLDLLGKPDRRIDDPNGDIELDYDGPYKSYCKIFLMDRVVTSTQRWEK
jgi:hypothetical protein